MHCFLSQECMYVCVCVFWTTIIWWKEEENLAFLKVKLEMRNKQTYDKIGEPHRLISATVAIIIRSWTFLLKIPFLLEKKLTLILSSNTYKCSKLTFHFERENHCYDGTTCEVQFLWWVLVRNPELSPQEFFLY